MTGVTAATLTTSGVTVKNAAGQYYGGFPLQLPQLSKGTPIKGGSYEAVRAANVGGDVHHMPGDSVSPISRERGPAIPDRHQRDRLGMFVTGLIGYCIARLGHRPGKTIVMPP